MGVMVEDHMDEHQHMLRGTPIEFRIVYSVAFVGACVSSLAGHRRQGRPMLVEAKEAAWRTALNTIPQTPFG